MADSLQGVDFIEHSSHNNESFPATGLGKGQVAIIVSCSYEIINMSHMIGAFVIGVTDNILLAYKGNQVYHLLPIYYRVRKLNKDETFSFKGK